MNFRRGSVHEDPEINLIPLIDVLLVILIFLMVTTTFSRFSELQINLPSADAEKSPDRPNEILIAVTAQGQYALDKQLLSAAQTANLAETLRQAAARRMDAVLVINADANATHQSVVNIMEAARIAQISRISFATQTNAAVSSAASKP